MRPLTALLLLPCLLTTGCLTTGPMSIRNQSGQYNRSVVKTLNEQLLLNLVRHKYRDIPYFIEVSSITSSKSTDVNATFGGLLNLDQSGGFSVGQTDSPTISYSPLQGEDFLKKVMTPIPPESLLVMMQSGWSAQRVFGICVERVNNLDNAASASGPTPTYTPRYEDFQRMTELLRLLQKADLVMAGADKEGGVVLKIADSAKYAGQLAEFRSLIGAGGGGGRYRLTTDFLNAGPDEVALRTRSISSILFFLSQNIDSPRAHIDKGLVTVTTDQNGNEFDWDEFTGSFMKVYSSKTLPPDAYISVFYRGWHFYVKDSDLNSKSTFMLLTQLFNLQAGQVRTQGPTLTIPVGG